MNKLLKNPPPFLKTRLHIFHMHIETSSFDSWSLSLAVALKGALSHRI